jgi:DNA-binding transcriptional MerR regulator
MTKETFTISELASQLDISPSTIRFYEEKGLLSPERTKGNQRIYTKKDRGRLKLILRGKRFGATLLEISEMIGMAQGEFNEVEQIDKSLFYTKRKLQEINIKRQELDLFEEDLLELQAKLEIRKKELNEQG